MSSELIKTAASQGVWAVLSVSLIFYVLKAQEKRDIKQEEREQNYQNIITNITDRLNTMDNIKSDVEDIKEGMVKKKNNYFD